MVGVAVGQQHRLDGFVERLRLGSHLRSAGLSKSGVDDHDGFFQLDHVGVDMVPG